MIFFRAIIISLLISYFGILSGCAGCSRSGRESLLNKAQGHSNSNEVFSSHDASKQRKSIGSSFKTTHDEPTSIKMQKVNGIYQIPVKINGIPMYFIFDTGASIVSISMLEATFLYKQGKLDGNDIIDNSSFMDANGNISEGTIINLRSVKIGNRNLHNIKASVVHNLRAPLLIGQTALEKFGKITIDYQNEEIIFQ